MSERVNDATAQKLEAAGLWRRAAARWLVVMNSTEYTDAQREWIRQRRQYCQSMVAPAVIAQDKLDISAINKAANAAQEKMGIARPNGAMFRAFPDQVRNMKKK